MTTQTLEKIAFAESPSWAQIAARKQDERSAAFEACSKMLLGKPIPSLPPPSMKNVRNWALTSGDLTPRQIEITQSIPSRLLHMLSTSVWSAEEVLLAFVGRATIAHHITNPITDIFLDKGMAMARELDEHLRRTGRPVGPLHGLPISLKDVINLRGHATTIGYIAFADRRMEDSDDLVKKLAAAGAVFYCKTNVPQSLMSGECTNFLFGRTSTPDNLDLSAGGSSGGEASLVAFGGSPLGIGTDIAGSIRTPANFNGIYGLCPSYGRLPLHSAKYASPSYLINGVAGPLSRSIDGLEVYTKSLLSLNPWSWDFTCVRMPWDQDLYDRYMAMGDSGELSFGFVAHDGVVQPHPPIQRGMSEVKAALRHSGFDVVDVDLLDGTEAMWEIAQKVFCCTGGKTTIDILDQLQEPLIAEMGTSLSAKALTTEELLRQGKSIFALRQKLLEKWLSTSAVTKSGKPVDVFILPSGGHVAPPHGSMEYFLYEAISNIIDWTCATIPVGRVDPHLDPKPGPSELFCPMSEWDRRNWGKYSPESYENGAICLQVMGQRFTEEKVLACLRAVDTALGRPKCYVA